MVTSCMRHNYLEEDTIQLNLNRKTGRPKTIWLNNMTQCGSYGSLTSRGMPLIPGLQHFGGKQTRAAAQRPSERVSVDA